MNDTRGDYMNNRRKKRNKRIIIGVFVVVILVSVIGFFVGRKQSRLEKTLSNSISMIEYYIIKKPISFVNDIFNEYNDLKDVYDENRILKEKLDSYVNVESENEVLQSEIKKLKKLTEMDYLPNDYKTKAASVQIRDQTNWNDEITIDAGSLNNVQEGMAVCDSKGMIGVVSHVTEISSTVSLLTSENPSNQIPVMIINGDQTIYGLLKNYDVNSLSRLEKIGTSSINEKYRILEARLYNIDDKFPKITLNSLKNNELPKGIIKIEYIVDLDDIDYETINLNF